MRERRQKMKEQRPDKYRAMLDAKNAARNATYSATSNEINAKRRERYKTDLVYRSKFFTDERKNYHRQNRQRQKKLIFEHYGTVCACSGCNESNPKFLTVDHINGGGNKHVNQIGRGNFYRWLVNNKFPEGFQTLCFNCNMGRAINGGLCPHIESSLATCLGTAV